MPDIRKGYDRLRLRYFTDAPPPLHVPPPARELRWAWLPDNSDAMAETLFDEDNDPFELRIRHRWADRWTVLKPTLLHELTHIRLGPQYSCGGWRRVGHKWSGPRISRSSRWHAETLRLVAAGAFQL